MSKSMTSKTALSVRVFSYYLVGLGAVLILVPNTLLELFALPPVEDVWIRVVGMLVVILAYYYWQASRHELNAFFRASVYGRCAVLVGFIAFVVTGLAPPILVLFGAIDAAAAGWTAVSLRAESRG